LTEGVNSNIPITIANIGNAPATGQLTFTSMLPNGITTQPTFTNNGWTCNTSGQTVSCTNPNTAGLPATTGTTTFNLTVKPSAGSAGQTPTISGTSAPVPNETVTGNNSGSLTLSTQIVAAVKPDLVISFGTPSPALAETVISNIPVTVSNIGTAAATGQLVVKINIPNNTTSLPSYASNGWTCNASGTILTCATSNFAGIAATASSTFDIKLTPMTGTAGQNIILTGLVETVTGETNTLNNNKTTIMVTPIAGPPAILINAKVMLQGAATTVNNPYALNADGMMRADITAMLPTAQPYTALGYANVTVKAGTPNFTGAGNNAIVDWVLVELRSSAASATVLARHAGLLQKDGDIVDIDGVSPLSIEVNSGNYFVSVRHRNHLGAMTAAAISLTGTATTVDFTNPTTVTYGTYAQVTIGGKNLLWAGNANTNNNVIAQGANSDRSTVTNSVTGTGANATGTNAYILTGYSTTDVNMDGKSIAKGTNADNTFILNTSLGHPNNGSGQSTFILAQQLP
jgi:hypothetical protein